MGTLFKVGGKVVAGRAAKRSADDEAAQLDRRASNTRASAQRAAAEEERNARLVASRGQAVAAASGAGAGDPTVVNLMADILGEGRYRALTALYEGEEQARSDNAAARTRRREGRAARTASYLDAAGDLFSKYGGEGV